MVIFFIAKALELITESRFCDRIPEMIIERAIENLRSRKVSFDIDNTVVDTYGRAVDVYNWFLGTNYRIADVKSNWQLAEWFKNDTSVEDPLAAARNFYNSRVVMVQANPVAGAISILSRIHKARLNPYFLSARPGSKRPLTFEWFGYWTPWFDRNSFLLQEEGDQVNPGFKVESINSQCIDYHFEDIPEDATIIHNNTQATIVMVNQPWNQDFSLDSRFIRSTDPKSMSSLAYAFLELAKSLQQ